MLVGVLLIPADAHVVEDLERWGIRRTVAIAPGAPIETIVQRRVRGESAMVFASPRRRWVEVMEALRAALQVVAGDLSLRFYQPTCTIDVRIPTEAGGHVIFPMVAEFGPGMASKAYAVRKAIREGIKDLEHERAERERQEFLRKADALLAGRKVANG